MGNLQAGSRMGSQRQEGALHNRDNSHEKIAQMIGLGHL